MHIGLWPEPPHLGGLKKALPLKLYDMNIAKGKEKQVHEFVRHTQSSEGLPHGNQG